MFHIMNGDLNADPTSENSSETSEKSENGTLHPTSHSNCYYKFSCNKTKQTIVKSNPCTNKPVSCYQCKGIFWSYNLFVCYKLTHQGINCPQMVSEEKKKLMLALK